MKIFFFVGMYCFYMHLGQGQEHEATPLIASAETSIQEKSHHVLQSPGDLQPLSGRFMNDINTVTFICEQFMSTQR